MSPPYKYGGRHNSHWCCITFVITSSVWIFEILFSDFLLMKYVCVTANSLNLDQTPRISESGLDSNYLHTQLRLRFQKWLSSSFSMISETRHTGLTTLSFIGRRCWFLIRTFREVNYTFPVLNKMDAETGTKNGIFLTWCFGKKSCHCVLFTISRIRFTG